MQRNSDLDLHDQALVVNRDTSHHTGKTKEAEVCRIMPYIEQSLRAKLYLQKNIRNYPDGGRYEGEFLKNKRHGKGTYFYNDGRKYVGDWVKDERSGAGSEYFKNGDRYEGEFLNDKANGKGTEYYANVDKHIGDWFDGKKQVK
jgi:hypothetical protein